MSGLGLVRNITHLGRAQVMIGRLLKITIIDHSGGLDVRLGRAVGSLASTLISGLGYLGNEVRGAHITSRVTIDRIGSSGKVEVVLRALRRLINGNMDVRLQVDYGNDQVGATQGVGLVLAYMEGY